MFNEDAVGLVDGFDRFNDGVMNYFKYEFLGDGTLSVHIEFCARDYRIEGNVWKRGRVIVAHVDEVRSTFSGGQTNVVCSGVKLLKFGEVWCVEVDGDHGPNDPSSLEEIRKYGSCYITGDTVEVVEVE